MRTLLCSVATVGLGIAALSGPSLTARTMKPIATPGNNEAVMPLSAADAGRTIRLDLRQQVSIQLEANPSTGYSWEVLSAQNVRVDQPIDVVNPSAAPTSTVGAPGIAIVKVWPFRAGRGFLILGYKRPWEKTVVRKIRYSFRITR